MPDPLLYLKAMGAAAIVSALVVLAMAGIRRPAGTARTQVACLAAIGLGLAAGYACLSWRPVWPPLNGLDRFLTVIIPAALGIEGIAGLRSVPRRLAWLARLSLAAASPRILLHGSVYLTGYDHDWNTWQIGTALVAWAALLAGVWGLLSWLARRRPGVSLPLSIGLTTQCAGLTVMMAGYLKGGAAAIPLAAALVAAALAAKRLACRTDVPIQGMANGDVPSPDVPSPDVPSPDMPSPDMPSPLVAPPLVGIGVVGLFGLVFIGRFFGRLSTGCAVVLLLAPLLCWVSETPWLRNGKPWLVAAIRLALVAILLTVVLVLAKRDFDRKMAPLLGNRRASKVQRFNAGWSRYLSSARFVSAVRS